jgi:methylthioribose-1-phosphate isomerase
MNIVESVKWSPDGRAVRIIDQRKLPAELVELDLHSVGEITDAIRTLAVRGAPAIGVAAAMGLASLASEISSDVPAGFRSRVSAYAAAIRSARPTAVNLAWAVDRVLQVGLAQQSPQLAADAMRREAEAIRFEDREMCRRIGEHGAALLADGMTVLTHCNTGALATAGIGTALAAIYVAHERGLRLKVLSSETRPLMQGSRLTAWELARAGIPVTVVAEGAVASIMRAGGVDVCMVGADRVARNGDVANKIGTYSHARMAEAHGVPFYVAAPDSTLDAGTPDGNAIEVEQRSGDELLRAAGHPQSTAGIGALNPAVDITPASLVTAIVTNSGVFRAPYHFGREPTE